MSLGQDYMVWSSTQRVARNFLLAEWADAARVLEKGGAVAYDSLLATCR